MPKKGVEINPRGNHKSAWENAFLLEGLSNMDILISQNPRGNLYMLVAGEFPCGIRVGSIFLSENAHNCSILVGSDPPKHIIYSILAVFDQQKHIIYSILAGFCAQQKPIIYSILGGLCHTETYYL